MNAVIDNLKKLPPLTQQVCGNCLFYQKDNTIARWSSCHAVGGELAHEIWPRCQGQMWQPRISLIVKFKCWLRGLIQ